MAQSQPNNISAEKLSAAYAKIASLEEKLSETRESVKVKLNELEALRAYYLRRFEDVEHSAQQSIDLLRDESKIADMIKQSSSSGAQSDFEAFADRTEALVESVAEQLDKGT